MQQHNKASSDHLRLFARGSSRAAVTARAADQRKKGMLTSVFLCVEPKWGWPTPFVGEDARRGHAHAALAAIVMRE